MAANVAVRAEGLTKRFGDRVAVNKLSFELPHGVVAGFIGPNGAGKTTTLAMLLGLLEPSDGGGEVLGSPLSKPGRFLSGVGALIESPAFYPGLSGAENLRVLAAMGGYDASQIPRLLAEVDLGERGDDRFKHYSLGMKQRLGIAGALLGDPQLLILDEPTNGLDPSGMRDIRDLVRSISEQNRTVLVSSHLLGEIQQICDYLIFIDGGRGVFAGPSSEFLDTTETIVQVTPECLDDLDRLRSLVRTDGRNVTIDEAGTGLAVAVGVHDDARAVAVALNRLAHANGIELAELSRRQDTLEERYLSIVEGAER